MERCEQQGWSILTWPRAGPPAPGAPNTARLRPFLCGSWRCRRCARWRGAVDWARCAAGVTSRRWWLYLVLTLDPQDFADPWDAYRRVGYLWDHGLARRIRRRWGGFDYLQTWERHRGGMPHLNLVVTGEGLERAVGAEPLARRRIRTQGGGSRVAEFPRAFRQELLSMATEAGFGAGMLWCEVIRPENGEAMAGYLVKLAQELTGARCKKGDQAPLMAPKRFRRIRASRGLLPRRAPQGELTGCLLPWGIFAQLDAHMNGTLDAGRRTTRVPPRALPISEEFRRELVEAREAALRPRVDARPNPRKEADPWSPAQAERWLQSTLSGSQLCATDPIATAQLYARAWVGEH